jgi:flagellar biogenesis protein FliO
VDEAASPEADQEASPASSDQQALPDPGAFRTLGEELKLIDGEEKASAGFSLPWLDRFDPRIAEFARVGGALAVVLGVMFLTRLVLKRAGGPFMGAGRPSGVLEVLARYPVGKGQSLILLKLARRILLVHQSGNQMRTLAEVTEGNEVAGLIARMEAGSRSREASRFRATLQAFESEHEDIADMRLPGSRHSHEDIEVVDLTRSQVGRLGSVLGRRRLRA